MNFDAVILGSGLAGFAAAVALRQRQKNVLVLTRGPGATSVSSGVWDFGPLDGTAEDWRSLRETVLAGGGEIFAEGWKEGATREIAAALEAELPLHFSFASPLTLPTSGGKWRRAYGAQKIQAASDAAALGGKDPCFVFSKRWRFNGAEVCKRWNEGGAPGQIQIRPLEIDFPREGSDWPIPSLATRLSRPSPLRTAFETALRDSLRAGSTKHLIFPPLFTDLAWVAQLERDLGVTISECAATVEPVPGFRLETAMRRTLEKLGVVRKEIKELEFVAAGKRLQKLRYLENDGQTRGEASPGSVVLATGKLFAGGIKINYETLEETVFGLPLFLDGESEPVARRAQIPWADRDFGDEQPWARLGLKLDARWRPLESSGDVVFENLYACGSLIGGVDFARSQLGLGFMSYTGRQCGGQIQ